MWKNMSRIVFITLNKKGRSQPHLSKTLSPSTLGLSEIHDFKLTPTSSLSDLTTDTPLEPRGVWTTKEGPDWWVPIQNSAYGVSGRISEPELWAESRATRESCPLRPQS
jgi:hypothetical protein